MSPEEQGTIDNFEGAINYEATMCNRDFYIIESQSALLMLEHAG
jgi:hypothetical protein